jgi:hypothetical protein
MKRPSPEGSARWLAAPESIKCYVIFELPVTSRKNWESHSRIRQFTVIPNEYYFLTKHVLDSCFISNDALRELQARMPSELTPLARGRFFARDA